MTARVVNLRQVDWQTLQLQLLRDLLAGRARRRARRPASPPRACPPTDETASSPPSSPPSPTSRPSRCGRCSSASPAVLDQIALAMRLVAGFSIVSGLVVMAGALGHHPLPAALPVGDPEGARRHPRARRAGLRRRVRCCSARARGSAGPRSRRRWPGRCCASRSTCAGPGRPARSSSASPRPSRWRVAVGFLGTHPPARPEAPRRPPRRVAR